MRKTILAAAVFAFAWIPCAQAQGPVVSLIVRGVPYVPIQTLSLEKGLEYHWDPLLKNVTVKNLNGFIKFHVGSEYVLSRGRLLKLKEKVRYVGGSVMAPISVVDTLNELILPQVVVLPKRFTTPAISRSLYGTSAPPLVLAPSRIRRIVVDAGHGGQDHGATSRYGTREKDLVLEVAYRVRDELRTLGLDVIMTRDSDFFVPLEERARIANARQADLFVSIHANASRSPSLKGFEIYCVPPWAGNDLEDRKDGEARRASIQMAGFVADAVERSVEISDRRIKSARFVVLRQTLCPAVLIEMGYITNRDDEKRLNDSSYRQKMARGIVWGLLDYKSQIDRDDSRHAPTHRDL
ncbi:MAG: N-acetylmuramoyl-L-alanine amidase [Candidatus Omnitrophota bacterium]